MVMQGAVSSGTYFKVLTASIMMTVVLTNSNSFPILLASHGSTSLSSYGSTEPHLAPLNYYFEALFGPLLLNLLHLRVIATPERVYLRKSIASDFFVAPQPLMTELVSM